MSEEIKSAFEKPFELPNSLKTDKLSNESSNQKQIHTKTSKNNKNQRERRVTPRYNINYFLFLIIGWQCVLKKDVMT